MTESDARPIYMTPACEARLRAELKETLHTLRPEMVKTAAWAASNGDRSENADYHYAKKMLRRYDSRIRFLMKRLEQAEVVDPLMQGEIAGDRILFGCTVTYEKEDGEEKTISIVGVDEYDPVKGYVSWTSPIGRALLGKQTGSEVTVCTPSGPAEIEVVAIEYKPLS